jgi:mRNA interferase MazF
MARGDVLLVRLPDHTAGSRGREQTGARPSVVVDADLPGVNLSTLMIVPFTSQMKAKMYPFTLEVQPSATNGLKMASVLLIFQLRAIDRRRIDRKLGTLEQSYMELLTFGASCATG